MRISIVCRQRLCSNTSWKTAKTSATPTPSKSVSPCHHGGGNNMACQSSSYEWKRAIRRPPAPIFPPKMPTWPPSSRTPSERPKPPPSIKRCETNFLSTKGHGSLGKRPSWLHTYCPNSHKSPTMIAVPPLVAQTPSRIKFIKHLWPTPFPTSRHTWITLPPRQQPITPCLSFWWQVTRAFLPLLRSSM